MILFRKSYRGRGGRTVNTNPKILYLSYKELVGRAQGRLGVAGVEGGDWINQVDRGNAQAAELVKVGDRDSGLVKHVLVGRQEVFPIFE